MSALIEKAKSTISLAKKYWHEPPKGNYISRNCIVEWCGFWCLLGNAFTYGNRS